MLYMFIASDTGIKQPASKERWSFCQESGRVDEATLVVRVSAAALCSFQVCGIDGWMT